MKHASHAYIPTHIVYFHRNRRRGKKEETSNVKDFSATPTGISKRKRCRYTPAGEPRVEKAHELFEPFARNGISRWYPAGHGVVPRRYHPELSPSSSSSSSGSSLFLQPLSLMGRFVITRFNTFGYRSGWLFAIPFSSSATESAVGSAGTLVPLITRRIVYVNFEYCFIIDHLLFEILTILNDANVKL